MFVGCVERELDLKNFGCTQQQFFFLLCGPRAEGIQVVAAASSSVLPIQRLTATIQRSQWVRLGSIWPDFFLLVALSLLLVWIGYVGILFSRVPFHIDGFVLPGGGRLGERAGCRLSCGPVGPALFGPRPFVREVLGTAKLVSQAVDLSDDQVYEGVHQLIKNLQMLVLFEAAQTLPGNNTEELRKK